MKIGMEKWDSLQLSNGEKKDTFKQESVNKKGMKNIIFYHNEQDIIIIKFNMHVLKLILRFLQILNHNNYLKLLSLISI